MHAQLGLPSHYRVHTSVEGYIGDTHYSVRMLRTDALGQHVVHAMSISWQNWQKVTGDQFMNIAKQILGVHPHGQLNIS